MPTRSKFGTQKKHLLTTCSFENAALAILPKTSIFLQSIHNIEFYIEPVFEKALKLKFAR